MFILFKFRFPNVENSLIFAAGMSFSFLHFSPKIASMRATCLIISLIFLASCNKQPCRQTVEPQKITLEVERLERELFQSTSAEEVEGFLEKHNDFSLFFLHADQYPPDSMANTLFRLIHDPSIDTLYREAVDAFQHFDMLVQNVEDGLGRLKVFFPETPSPKIQTIVTGLYNDLFISNKHIMIGMDFFIGKEATFQPQQIPNYILRRYNTEHLPANILQFISGQYITTTKGEAMLSEMINYGKSYYLLSKILPCTPEHVLIGYTEEEWNTSFEHDEIIWANFVENKLIYETNHHIKKKFLGDRPNVHEIGDKCPGRIGQWLGWQIINAYAEKSGVSVRQLMSETDANKIFNQSGYKPTSG